MLGVTFGSKHSYNDWGIWLEDTHISPPLPKRYIVDVPARNGLLDLTPELTPTIRFENRTLTFNFRVKAGDWSTLVSQIHGDIHGRTLDVVSDLDPNWHWHGCVTVDDFSSDERTGKLVITVDADPFKLSNTENSYTVNGNGTITCVVDRMEISPAFELTAPTTVIYGDSSYAIESTATTEKTLSGDIVSFIDGTENPAVDLTADIDAVQDLHGYDYPWVGGAGKNKFDISKVITKSGRVVNNGDGTLTITTPSSSSTATATSPNTLGDYAQLEVGQTYTLSATTTGSNYIYLQGANVLWTFGTSQTITSEMLTSIVNFYANGVSSTVTISNIQIELGSTATAYEPYSNICPISGWDEVNVNVAGINVWDEDWERGSLNTSGQPTASNTQIRSKNYIRVSPSSSYYVVAPNDIVLYQYDENKNYITRQGIHNATITLNTKTKYLKFRTSDVYGATYNNDISINYPSTEHDYHSYNGQTYTIDLDGTRYGGTLDVTTGVLTVTHTYVELNIYKWTKNWSSGNPTGVFYTQVIATAKASGDLICDSYKVVSNINPNALDNGCITMFSNARIYIKNTDYTDDTTLKSSLSGKYIAYELATPQTVQLTAEQVMILKNQNNIWADSGEVEVTYLAQDFAGKTFYIPDLELTEGSHELTIQGTGTTTVTYTNGRL